MNNVIDLAIDIDRDIRLYESDWISGGAKALEIGSEAGRNLFDSLITDRPLNKKIKKLFYDGHYSRAVEESFKFLDNLVRTYSKISGKSGSNLMHEAFGPKAAILKLNDGNGDSEKDEQTGYMEIFSGCMTGIRNPRAHESEWQDSEFQAIQLLSLANHLVGKVRESSPSQMHANIE